MANPIFNGVDLKEDLFAEKNTAPWHNPLAILGSVLPTDSNARKEIPVCTGVLDYFPAAIAEVARVSKAGNTKHNPGKPMHHNRSKSSDHADTIVRHLMERGTVDPSDGQRHSAKVAWRSLAMLQEELEAEGAPKARGAR